MRCFCEFENGEEREVFVKYKDFHDDLSYDHLCGELVANQFAIDLGLPAAHPCLVEITEDFLGTLPNDDDGLDIKKAFVSGHGIAFGSVAFSPVRRWAFGNLVHKGQLEDAVRLYLFDTFIENSDRGVKNPNLLVSGNSFKVIDFGHSFQRCHSDSEFKTSSKPWQTGGILNHFPGDLQHVLYSELKNVTVESIERFTADVRSLSDDLIENYVSIVPAEWGQDTACKIVDFLLDARENVTQFEARVKEVLL